MYFKPHKTPSTMDDAKGVVHLSEDSMGYGVAMLVGLIMVLMVCLTIGVIVWCQLARGRPLPRVIQGLSPYMRRSGLIKVHLNPDLHVGKGNAGTVV